MTEAPSRSLDPDSSPDTLTRIRVALLVAASIAFALFRVWARARSAWDWDESLFALALRDFDVVRHHPHPPGFPLYIGLARLVSLVVPGEFEALRAVNLAAGALLFPVAFFMARSVGFGFNTSFAGAILLFSAPNVLFFGAGAFSDVPSLVVSLAAAGMLLRGHSSPRAFVIGMALAGAASSIRVQNVLVCALPALLALALCWRASRRAAIAGLALAALIVVGSYGGAVAATGSWESYAGAVEKHGDYIARVDSWRSPDRAALGEVAASVFVLPFRGVKLPALLSALALLALVDLVAHRHRPSAIVAGMFLPMMLFATFMLDPHSMPRFSIAWMPFHAILAARGAAIVAAMVRSWLHTPVTEVQWLVAAPLALAMVARTLPALQIVRTTDSPPVAAIREVARLHDPRTTTVWVVEGATAALAWLELGPYGARSAATLNEIPIGRDGRDAVVVAEGEIYGAERVFRRERAPFDGLARKRFFEVSIVPVESIVRFGDGWFDPDEGDGPTARWMGGASRMTLGASAKERTVTLHLRLPRETGAACSVEVAHDGEVVTRRLPSATVFEFDVDIPLAPGDTQHEIAIRVDRTFRPVDLEPGSTDTRDLGLRLLGMEVR
ncbi:MAG: hypothetical protein WC538_20540 [Thermoanaerobaculia bacterium]|jgi:hypothetical protein